MNDNKNFNKCKKAVAIKYDVNDVAPKVVAVGKGVIADKIVFKGTSNKIPIYKDDSLVEELSKINIGDNIPPELYHVVAEILVFITNLDKKIGKKRYGK